MTILQNQSNKILKRIFLLLFLFSASSYVHSQYYVKWTNIVGADYDTAKYTLTKTATNSWMNCGAISENKIEPYQDAYANFTVESTDIARAFGLSEYNTDPSLKSLGYAFQVRDYKLFIIIDGQIIGRYGNVEIGDQLSVARIKSDQIAFMKNGHSLYHVSTDPSDTLYIDVCIFKQGNTITSNITTNGITEELVVTYTKTNINCVTGTLGNIDLLISGGTQPYKIEWKNGENTHSIYNLDLGKYYVSISDYIGQTVKYEIEILKDIEWKYLTGCIENPDGSITSTVPKPWGNCGGLSYNGINIKEKGFIQLTIDNLNSERGFGLSTYNADNHFEEIEYCYFISGNKLQIIEKGKIVGEYGELKEGDILKIYKLGGKLVYIYNGKEIRGVEIINEQILFADFAILKENGVLEKIETDFCFPNIFDLDYSTEQNPNEYCKLTTTLNSLGGYPPYSFQWKDLDTSQTRDLSPGIYGIHVSDNYQHDYDSELKVLAPVIWTEYVGTEMQGENLVKIVGGDWGTGGAISKNQLAENEDGYFIYKVNDFLGEKCIGLSHENIDASLKTIDFFFFISSEKGSLSIFRKGELIGDFGEVKSGDKLKIEKKGNEILFYINDILLHNFHTEYPQSYYIDVALNKQSSFIEPVYASFCEKPEIIVDYTTVIDENCELGSIFLNITGGVPPYNYQWDTGDNTQNLENQKKGYYTLTIIDDIGTQKVETIGLFPDIIWTDLVGVEQRGDTIIKTIEGPWGTGGAASENILLSNQSGFVSCIITDHQPKCIGLSSTNIDAHFRTIDYCFYSSSKGIYIYEKGEFIGYYGNWKIQKELKIEKHSNKILYWNDGNLVRTSEIKEPSKLIADIALIDLGSFFVDVNVSFCIHSFSVNAGQDTTICSGNTVTLKPTGAALFEWKPNSSLSCFTCTNPVAKPTVTTSYIVTGYDKYGSYSIDTVTVIVDNPDFLTLPSDTNICKGDNLVLTANGGDTYIWTPSESLSCSDCSDPTATPIETTNYYVTSYDNNGCINEKVVTVSVFSGVNAIYDDAICTGETTKIGGTGASYYYWEPSSSFTCSTCQYTTLTPSITQQYTLTGTNIDSTCVDTMSFTITVEDPPLPINAGQDQKICVGNSIQLDATGNEDSDLSYSWEPPLGLDDPNTKSPNASPLTTTYYTVTCKNNAGCSEQDHVKITVNQYPVLVLSNNDTIVKGESTKISAGSVAEEFYWSPSYGLRDTSASFTSASPDSTTTYIVSARNGECLTTSDDEVTIVVIDSPDARFKYSQTDLTISFESLNRGEAEYLWDFGDNSVSTVRNPSHEYLSPGTYTVTLTITNRSGQLSQQSNIICRPPAQPCCN